MQYRASKGLRAAVCAALLIGGFGTGQALALPQATDAASADVRELTQWVTGTGDHKGKPFAIVDKKQARLHVFDARGRLVDSSIILLGSTVGDESAPGVGARAQRGEVGPEERTTPAGRFESVPGKNLDGEHVVWVDYSAAFAIHRLRAGRSYEPRKQRLGTETPEDNRVSLGCVVVPEAFYIEVVQRVLGNSRGVVYVMPETKPASELFGASGA
jgi:hypothetical protein